MSETNKSFITEFVIVGFPGLDPHYYGMVSALLFIVYLAILAGNTAFLVVFATEQGLHKPMYFIILNLVLSDILFSTTTLPKIIAKYWFKAGTISFTGCFVQMFFVHYFGSANSFILLIMSIDRYVAICFPLRYPVIIKNSNVLILSITAWLVASTGCLMTVIRAYPLPYCSSNTIIHCFCDHISITTLACTDRTPYAIPALISAMVVLLVPLAFIIFSYLSIIVAVLRISSTKARVKTFSTCSGQLTIIALYYIPRIFVYMSSSVFGIKFNTDLRLTIILLYSLSPPMLNPLIYFLRTEEIKKILITRLSRLKIRAHSDH